MNSSLPFNKSNFQRIFFLVVLLLIVAVIFNLYFSNLSSEDEAVFEPLINKSLRPRPEGPIPNAAQEQIAAVKPNGENKAEAVSQEPDFPINPDIWNWIQKLKGSETTDDLLILSLLPGLMVPNQDNEAVLLLAYSKDPNNELLGLRIMEYCYQHRHSSLCALPVIDNLLENNSDDGVTIANIAGFLVEDGDPNRALDLLSRAGELNHSNRLQMRLVELADRSFTKHGFSRSHVTLFELEGIADGAFPDLRRIHGICAGQTQWDSKSWQLPCANYFDNLSKNSNNLVEGGIAIYSYIQFSGMTKQQAAKALKLREEKLLEANLMLSQTYADLEAKPGASESLIDDETWQLYLDQYASEGDVIARNNLIRSILRDFESPSEFDSDSGSR